MRAARQWLAVFLGALLAAACSRGPGEAELTQHVQSRLDGLFGQPVLVLRGFKRQGSAPFADAPDGSSQVIVYYNANLEFAAAYDPSDWEGLSPELIASALGTADQGLFGLESGRMEPGAELRAYGSLIYRDVDSFWQPTKLQAWPRSGQSKPGDAAAGLSSNELIQRLSQLVNTSPGLDSSSREIVTEELGRAVQNIRLRLDQGDAEVVVATGPEGGEYARFMGSLVTRIGASTAIRVATTEGSVANALLVDQGKARFGLVQSDVAAAAVTGEGLFAATGPLRHLRAAASLFPEPVHIVVRAESTIDSIRHLTGRRLSLGLPGSGTRQTALRVLDAHGLAPGAYEEIEGLSPEAALHQLADDQLDAVVLVVSAPWGELTQLAESLPLRLLSLEPAAIDRIEAEVHGVTALIIPARTYPGQMTNVRSVAATALLVANSQVPEALVEAALSVIFAAGEKPGRGTIAARVSRERALTGVTIPVHDGAARYFEEPGSE